jgi:hypothetical protein
MQYFSTIFLYATYLFPCSRMKNVSVPKRCGNSLAMISLVGGHIKFSLKYCIQSCIMLSNLVVRCIQKYCATFQQKSKQYNSTRPLCPIFNSEHRLETEDTNDDSNKWTPRVL